MWTVTVAGATGRAVVSSEAPNGFRSWQPIEYTNQQPFPSAQPAQELWLSLLIEDVDELETLRTAVEEQQTQYFSGTVAGIAVTAKWDDGDVQTYDTFFVLTPDWLEPFDKQSMLVKLHGFVIGTGSSDSGGATTTPTGVLGAVHPGLTVEAILALPDVTVAVGEVSFPGASASWEYDTNFSVSRTVGGKLAMNQSPLMPMKFSLSSEISVEQYEALRVYFETGQTVSMGLRAIARIVDNVQLTQFSCNVGAGISMQLAGAQIEATENP